MDHEEIEQVDDQQSDQHGEEAQFSIKDVEEVDQAFVQAVLVNKLKIGKACTPYEVIKVKTASGYYPVTLIYDTGSQISLCNYQAGPLLLESKLADRKVTISTVNGARAKIRKIYTLKLDEDIKIDAILIPKLQLNLKSMTMPEEFQDLEEEFADQETFNVEAQILIGADKSKIFPDWVKNEDGTFKQTETCRLMRSTITNKIIMFGACEGHEHSDHDMSFEEEDTGCYSNQVNPNVEAISALASVMETMAIGDFENASMVSDSQ